MEASFNRELARTTEGTLAHYIDRLDRFILNLDTRIKSEGVANAQTQGKLNELRETRQKLVAVQDEMNKIAAVPPTSDLTEVYHLFRAADNPGLTKAGSLSKTELYYEHLDAAIIGKAPPTPAPAPAPGATGGAGATATPPTAASKKKQGQKPKQTPPELGGAPTSGTSGTGGVGGAPLGTPTDEEWFNRQFVAPGTDEYREVSQDEMRDCRRQFEVMLGSRNPIILNGNEINAPSVSDEALRSLTYDPQDDEPGCLDYPIMAFKMMQLQKEQDLENQVAPGSENPEKRFLNPIVYTQGKPIQDSNNQVLATENDGTPITDERGIPTGIPEIIRIANGRPSEIYVPMQLGFHWILIKIDTTKEPLNITYFDSNVEGQRVNGDLHKAVLAWANSKIKKADGIQSYKIKTVQTIGHSPQQDNGSDCGVFVIANAELLKQGHQLIKKVPKKRNGQPVIKNGQPVIKDVLAYGPKEIPEVRKRIVGKIYEEYMEQLGKENKKRINNDNSHYQHHHQVRNRSTCF